MHRLRKNGKRILFFLFLLYFAALIVPYIPHKKVVGGFPEIFSGQRVLREADRRGAGSLY